MPEYTGSVAKLLEIDAQGLLLGEIDPEFNYVEHFGLTNADVPQLRTMAMDEALISIENYDDPRAWAPIHALRALGFLGTQDAINTLVDFLHELRRYDDIIEDISGAFATIGAPAIPSLQTYLADTKRDQLHRSDAVYALTDIGNKKPETQTQIAELLTNQLKHYETNGRDLNATIISTLADWQVYEALPIIEAAYEANVVEGFFIDWEDVQVIMGLKESRDTPAARMLEPPVFTPPPSYDNTGLSGINNKADAKKKQKRKQAKASRKQNRKKKKK